MRDAGCHGADYRQVGLSQHLDFEVSAFRFGALALGYVLKQHEASHQILTAAIQPYRGDISTSYVSRSPPLPMIAF